MPELATPNLDALRDTLPVPCRDLRLNVGAVLAGELLTVEQTWGVSLAAGYYLRDIRLCDALRADATLAGVSRDILDDAKAAASLMAMNTIYYRFRHTIDKPSYSYRPANLRMTWMARPKTAKADYELMCLTVAVLTGCAACIRSHEVSILHAGLGEEHVHEAVRIAAVLHGFSVALHTV